MGDSLNPEVLLAGSIGALSVFVLGAVRDLLRRRRELRGLSRLIDIEIKQNNLSLDGFYKDPSRVFADSIGTIRLETWDATRVQLAELMPTGEFGHLAFYYLFLQELKHISIARSQFHDSAGLAGDLLKQIKRQESDAAKAALKYSNMRAIYGFRTVAQELPENTRSVSGS